MKQFDRDFADDFIVAGNKHISVKHKIQCETKYPETVRTYDFHLLYVDDVLVLTIDTIIPSVIRVCHHTGDRTAQRYKDARSGHYVFVTPSGSTDALRFSVSRGTFSNCTNGTLTSVLLRTLRFYS
ncbi:hypothetical protein CLF_102896 [Clonorchis sinensis]|uniref:Uncharacterized protein n=1 Tax=Clonorchis sinensis TaxID=79923 RepID=G7YN87_CLOSI|nr:hypothetical protein CLF_102896 [Clonorchis sinensis]